MVLPWDWIIINVGFWGSFILIFSTWAEYAQVRLTIDRKAQVLIRELYLGDLLLWRRRFPFQSISNIEYNVLYPQRGRNAIRTWFENRITLKLADSWKEYLLVRMPSSKKETARSLTEILTLLCTPSQEPENTLFPHKFTEFLDNMKHNGQRAIPILIILNIVFYSGLFWIITMGIFISL